MATAETDAPIHLGIVTQSVAPAILAASLAAKPLPVLYIDPKTCGSVHAFAAELAAALLAHPVTPSAADLAHLEGSYRFRAENDPRVSVHGSADQWLLLAEEDTLFAHATGASQLFVKPFPDHWEQAFLYLRQDAITHVTLWTLDDSEYMAWQSLFPKADVQLA